MGKKRMKSKKIDLVKLHIFLMIFSFFGMCSKLAAQEKFLSSRFLIYYAIVLCNLAVYAIVWQQIIKKMQLTTAYANKAVGVAWGMVFGRIFFGEIITLKKILGMVIIILGIILFVTDRENQSD